MSRELLARHLYRAIEDEDAVSLERWLKESADPNLVLPDGVAAVHLASGKDTEGGIRCLKLLLQHGANPNVRSTEDLTPLHVAASWGCVKSLKLLLRSGADPTLQDQDGLTAQDLADEQGNVKCRQILQEYYNDSLLENTEEEPPMYQYVSYRRVSTGFHFFPDLVEFGITESHTTGPRPGRSNKSHSVHRTQQPSTLEQSGLNASGPSAIGDRLHSHPMEINPRCGPLGDDTSIWSESLRPQSLSGTMKPQGLGHHMGIAEDKSKYHTVGETMDVTLDDCILSSTHVETYGKFVELSSNELSSATDCTEYHTSVGQELPLQDDESFSFVSAPQPPQALGHRLNVSIDDESFLPPSASQQCPAENYRLNSSTNHLPQNKHFLIEPLCAQRGLYEEKEVFKDGDVSVIAEWLSELDCSCTLEERPGSSESLSSTKLSLAKQAEFCDSELLIRPSKRQGIDITSPDHIYLFEHTHLTTQHELDKTTAVLLEDTLSCTMEIVDAGSPLSANSAQHNGGDPKASTSISDSSSTLYCSCESGSECFPNAAGMFERARRTEQVQADTGPCLARETQKQEEPEPVSACTGEVAAVGIHVVHSRDLQTIPFEDSQFIIRRMCRDSPLRTDSEGPQCRTPRQCNDSNKGHLYTHTSTDCSDILQSSQAEPVYVNSCDNEKQTTVAKSSLKQLVNLNNEIGSSLDVLSAMNANIHNHKIEHFMAEAPSDHMEDEDFLGLLRPSAKQSSSSTVPMDKANLQILHRGSASTDSDIRNKTKMSLTEECSSAGGEKEDGGAGLEKLLQDIKLGNETGLSVQIGGDGLSPFVTPRTKSRLANSASRSYNSSLFEQTIVTPTRVRRVRKQQMVDARSPFGALGHGGAVCQGVEDEDETCSFAHSRDDETADFDTVPFVRWNNNEKETVQPLAPGCSEQGDADFDTVPFPNPNCEKQTSRSPSPMDDANSNKQCIHINRQMNASSRSQTVPLPKNLEQGGISQDDCFCPPMRQQEVAHPNVRVNYVSRRRSCNSSENNDLQSELGILKEGHGVNGAAELSCALPQSPSPCPSPVLLAVDPETDSSDRPLDSKVCESTRLEDTGLPQGTPGQRCSFSRWPGAGRLSKIPNHDGEWQSLMGDLELQLSPGGRPVNGGESEMVEYLYTDTEEGHTFIERRYPCTDVSVENLSTSGSEETVIYDWRAYKNGDVLRPEEKENELPKLSPRLQLLSNSQIRRQLKDYGEDPGPVTDFTRKVYLHSLNKIRKDPFSKKPQQPTSYSPELCRSLETFVFPDCSQDELALVQQFEQPDQNRKWREGLLKSSFNYLLLDPRVTKNLPIRCHTLSSAECFRTFVSSIFYVGKGKRSRPYCHLYDALTHFKNINDQVSAKLKQILDIWESGLGVISLHCFQNVIPVEAYTREACMVDALGLQMLTNKKRGDYYGIAATWPLRKRRLLGVHMLRRALQIFLAEGERQLRPADIRSGQ
ncbi:ankyrin repeat and LEM domain-containing protein 1 [Stegostoma tigrinum]|uniref:ankyrin repeat and LEM domain-containing protein 1 n=1 Tax=Stegostoma tigrinum TaxID=3053191 RepID=UPI0028706DE8|nr:ankyrin repeat and LEM domain-containing protein 1 [Stegostoma tigrinum]